MSKAVVFVYKAVVEEVLGVDDYIVIDLDGLINGKCPLCHLPIDNYNNYCEHCKINWDEEGRGYDYLYRKICEG